MCVHQTMHPVQLWLVCPNHKPAVQLLERCPLTICAQTQRCMLLEEQSSLLWRLHCSWRISCCGGTPSNRAASSSRAQCCTVSDGLPLIPLQRSSNLPRADPPQPGRGLLSFALAICVLERDLCTCMAAVLLEWTRWSLISLISTVALFVIITSFLWATLANALNRCGLCHWLQCVSCIIIMRLTRCVVKHL